MHLILLGGISIKNKAWIEDVNQHLESDYATQILYYDHWQTGKEEMDFEQEAQKLQDLCSKLYDYVIFAKSGGSWITLKLVAEGKIKPNKIVLIGPAWNWARSSGFNPDKLASQINIPVLIIDKTNDPSLPFAQLKEEVDKLNQDNFKLIEVPGDTHNYDDVANLTKEVKNYLSPFHSA